MNNHKSEYGVIQTIRFMIRQAVKEAPAVLVWLVVDAILALILQLLELYVTPVLLRDIEEQIALKELVTTILFFSSGILLHSLEAAPHLQTGTAPRRRSVPSRQKSQHLTA